MFSHTMNKEYFDSIAFEKKYHCDIPLGSFCSSEGTLFRLWAPMAEKVVLHLYLTGNQTEIPQDHMMRKQERGLWTLEFPENLDGYYYTYDVTTDGKTWTAGDPYAKACGLNGERSMVIDLRRTDPEGWQQEQAPEKPPENIIYEVHIKDFSWDSSSGVSTEKQGKFSGLWESGTTLHGDGLHPTGLDYLKELGVTHIQLMPSFDYGSVDEAGDEDQFNWGYDPVNYNVPEGYYSSNPSCGDVRIREYKEMIQALHQNGFRVILDVVYNHTYHLDSNLFRTVPWYYYRQNADGTESNGSGCGNDIASERSMCAKYILDSVLYWAEEYHIDGFRFDLMGLLDVDLMNRIRKELDIRYGVGEKMVFGEPWSAQSSAVKEGTVLAQKDHATLLDDHIGVFCDATRDAIKGGLWNPEDRGFVNGGAFSADWLACCLKGWAGDYKAFRVNTPQQTINYVSCHDDWTLWDRLVYTMDEQQDFDKIKPEQLQANRLAAAINFSCQGNVFLLSGEEFARTKQGVRDSYATPLTINRLDWERAWENHALVEYYKGFFALRKKCEGLCDKSRQAAERWISITEPKKGCAMAVLDNSGENSIWNTLLLLFYVGKTEQSIILPEGSWQILADGENSFLWKETYFVHDTIEIKPVSALILGKK